MTFEQRKHNFIALGKFLGQCILPDEEISKKDLKNPILLNEMKQKIQAAVYHNAWFTKDNLHFAFKEWHKALSKENLEKWLESYEIGQNKHLPKTVGIVMAGNIPLVGFHDFLSVLISGHRVLVKQSSNDNQLLPLVAKFLIEENNEFKEYIEFAEGKLANFDAIIATGSNNTARYFEYYFASKPHIIRKNRNSIAVLSGQENKAQLEALSEDIFRYYGLGCRNVSKLYVPKDYDFDNFFKAMYSWKALVNKDKYINNYDYNKAVYLMNDTKLLDNGFLLLKKDFSFGSPIGCLFFEEYEDEKQLKQNLQAQSEKIQCIVSHNFIENEIAFGQTQQPQLWDYADDVDTVDFLLKL